MQLEELKRLVIEAMEEIKAEDIKIIEVSELTSITDLMIIASGRSTRQVRAIADNVIEKVKHAGVTPLGVEGQQPGDWVLVDLADIVVHVMMPEVRDFYNLEKLWSVEPGAGNKGSQKS
jgi:ribosome-associated protein